MNPRARSNPFFGPFGTLLVSLCWGFGGPASYLVTRSLSASQATFGRCWFAALGLFPFFLIHGRKIVRTVPIRGLALLIASGTLLGIHFYFFVSGVAHASLATAVTLVAVEPALILSVGVLLFKEKLNRLSLAGIGFCIAGILVISVLPHLVAGGDSNESSSRNFGDLAAVLAVLTYAGYYALNRSFKPFEDRLKIHPSPIRSGFAIASILYLFAALTSGLILLLSPETAPAGSPLGSPGSSPDLRLILAVAASGLIPTIGGHTLSQIVSRRAHPIWVSLMSPGETLMSLLIGFLFLGQNLGIHELLGGTLILAGAGCAIAGEKKA